MVFERLGHLARPYLSTAGKPVFHGYQQSFFAASHQTSFRHKQNKVSRPQTSHLHSTSKDASGIPADANKAGHAANEGILSNGYGFNTYLETWKKAREEGIEWQQGKFPKRIEWKTSSVDPDAHGKGESEVGSRSEALFSRTGIDRTYSTSAVDDIKKAENEAAEAAAVAKVDEAIAEEIAQIQQSSAYKVEQTALLSDTIQEPVLNPGRSAASTSTSPVVSAEDSAQSPHLSDVTAATSTQEVESQAFSEHISKLHEQHSYGQIPAVFESMLVQGLRPTVKDYNALLASAIHLPIAKHQIVPKALDVYSDMLRRKITPDTAFYATIIQVLSRRALEVLQMKDALEKKRLRFGGMNGSGRFLFTSNEAEQAILAEDDALHNAVKIFDISNSVQQSRLYSAETYELLVTACAMHGQVDTMIRIFSHMESQKVKPVASMFPPMIDAFAKSGELVSALESYNGYRSLAVVDNAGVFTIINRNDDDVYAALIKAYVMCDKSDGANRFLAKILESYADITQYSEEQLECVQDSLVLDALVQERLDAQDFTSALRIAEERLSPSAQSQAMSRICALAADHGNADLAKKAYQYVCLTNPEASGAVFSMLALSIRQGDVAAARIYWSLLSTTSKFDPSFVEPTALYAVALIRDGSVDEALTEARVGFGRIRGSTGSVAEVTEQIDEAIEFLGAFIAMDGVVPSPNASMSFLWAMIENGGLVSPVAEQLLAGLGPEDIVGLSLQDMTLALQVEAGLLGNGQIAHDIAHSARFGHLLDIAVTSGAPLDERTTGMIEKALGKLANERPDLVGKWQKHQQVSTEHAQRAFTPLPSPALTSTTSFADTYDPYAANTDFRGSTIIAEELENRRSNAGLNEALLKFRNIRRAGQHPRYIVYAKLISAAAKEGRANLIFDILGMARTDMPYLTQITVVRHGWSSILDAMVGACLTVGRRQHAAQFHQEMLEMGTAPTANTFGLYITTLKESTKTFDEASEAVAIFARAISEGVAPSSFLYNALIGKLGKARRIDDCLRYFQEMRAAGIRPTSVTYGTVVNALCRVSDDRFAEELFDEMESMPNYKPRPAPYNSLMQFFLGTKRDSPKVLAYYERMQAMNIQPTMHTYKLLIDTYATLEPINLAAAEGVLDTIRASGQRPEAVHYASLIHAKGCALHDMAGARQTFDSVLASGEIRAQACLYQALFESMVANHWVAQTEEVLDSMTANGVAMTPYIANTLIHGWAMENTVAKSKAVYDSLGMEKREPSTYEAMTRAFLTAQDRVGALATVREMLSRGYPSAVSSKIMELIAHGTGRNGVALPNMLA
jgi:pentatricopeptide repeat protein